MVMGANDTTEILKNLVAEKNEEKIQEPKKPTTSEEKKDKIDNSFYTNSLSFTQSDFDDFNDLKEDVESHKLLLHIIIIVITIAIIIGIVILLNSVLHLGLF